jgi:lysophospholipase L1-like esterase
MSTSFSRRAFLASGAAVLAGPPSWLTPDLWAHDATADQQAQPDPGLEWTSIAEWQLEGRAFNVRKAPFDRLPAAAEGVVPAPVWSLSRQSAGIAARFQSDATAVHVRYRLTSERLSMPHMPASGVSGVDLYARDSRGHLRWVRATLPASRDVTARLATGISAERREWVLYLPLYNGIESLEIGIPGTASLAPAPPPPGRPIAVYGTSIAQGACASRPGMAWTAIVGRTLDREIINLGFSGNGRMEPEVGRFVAELDPAAFVIDCLPNMTPAQVAERVAPFARQLRAARPLTPILFVEDRTFGHAWIQKSVQEAHAARRLALRNAIAELRTATVTGIHHLPGADLLGDDDEGTTDGSHPNDLGMTRQAAAVVAALRPLLM